MLATAGALGAAGGVLWLVSRPADPEERARRLGAAHGIVVGLGNPSSFHVPPFVPSDAAIAGVDFQAAEREALGPALDGIEASLVRYPEGLVSRLIKAIFVAGSIRIDGAAAGGTYGPAWIILAAPIDIGAASIELTCRMGVHHELSSFVYTKGDIAEQWRRTEPETWAFARSASGQLGADGQTAPPIETGFLSAYGATSSENDFNVYAERMMTDMASMMRLADKVPVVARKVALVRQAYLAVDSRMGQVLSGRASWRSNGTGATA